MKSIPKSMGFGRSIVVIGLALSLNAGAAVADVVPVVSANNTLTTLNKYQVEDIFLGKASRFPDGSQAVAIDQAEGSEVRDEFYDSIAGMSAAQLKAHWSKIIFTGRGRPPETVADGNTVKNYLSQNPNAIGYIERSQVDDSVKVLVVQ